MRIDWYTKGVLTIIAMLLGVIAIRPYVSPYAVAHAQGSFAGVQANIDDGITGSGIFFDTRSGEMWVYLHGQLEHKFQVTKLGQPIVKIK